MLILIFSIILVVGLLIAGSCYGNLVSLYKKYSQTDASINKDAITFVSACIKFFKLNTKIALTEGEFQDAYLVNKDMIVLTKQVASGKSVADIAVASHELGHALQKKEKSGWLVVDLIFKTIGKIANFLLPIALITALVFLFFEDLSMYSPIIFYISIGLWFLTILMKIAVIPLELDASKKAYKILSENKLFSREELKQTKQVLNAAALTYVGSIFFGLYKLIRKIQYSFRRDWLCIGIII